MATEDDPPSVSSPTAAMELDGATMQLADDEIDSAHIWQSGDPVWFEVSNLTCLAPGIVVNYDSEQGLVSVESDALTPTAYEVPNTCNSICLRSDFLPSDSSDGVDDMIYLKNVHTSSLFWNLKKRYTKNKIYTFIGDTLVSLNPYKMFEIYGLNIVKKYQGQISRSSAPPHLFAIGNLAYTKMVKDNENQSIVLIGKSGSGKTENTKLLLQYLAAINKSPSNIITEQILESIPLLEAFGNAKTSRNNNASRYCKYLEVFFHNGVIVGAKTTEFLHEKLRIVSHSVEERNYHIFYELLSGLSEVEKEKYGLQGAEKYFYLNQGGVGHLEIEGKDDSEDFRFLIAAMQVLGFTNEEQDIIFRVLASILHLGNVYFHRKQYRGGQEGVEIGSDAEIRWVSHLLQIPIEDLFRLMTVRVTETRVERIHVPLNIDQALDMRDAISKLIYVSLFSWIVHRINNITYYKGVSPSGASSERASPMKNKLKITLLDMFGFENLKENNFEQLCINYANECAFAHYIKCVFKMEQAEYIKEKIEWIPVNYPDNQAVLTLISKKPIGILPLLEDESNFPKASDNSFLEKCHYNHALNELYSRARVGGAEFGIRHFEGQVWYHVEGFLDKNRNILKPDVVEVLLTSKMPIMSRIFAHARDLTDQPKQVVTRADTRFVTMKPRASTVSARFQDVLATLYDKVSKCRPWFIRCIRPNDLREPMLWDDSVVYEQLRHSALVEAIQSRQNGYPVRLKYSQFAARYRSFLTSQLLPRGTPSKEITRLILEKKISHGTGFRFGFSKIFLKESVEMSLEKERLDRLACAAVKIQALVKGYITRKRYNNIRRGIVSIQAAYRGYRQRKTYATLRKGMVRLQATYRMHRALQEYDKIRTLKRKREAERFREKSVPKTLAEPAKSTSSPAPKPLSSTSSGSVNASLDRTGSSLDRLEYPLELTQIMLDFDSWKCVHSYADIVKQSKAVVPLRAASQLPHDIDQHSFAKFTHIYFRSQVWGARREPIKTPFLAKNCEQDYQQSLKVFKLVLRFMNDSSLSGKREKALADYIVQMGLSNCNLRDEILCQLCNQTWRNDNSDSCDRAWTLMIHCLSSFAPSPLLYKYLLKYVSDHAPSLIRPILQRLLLSCDRHEPFNSRAYPATLLEWKATERKCGMALEVNLANGDTKLAQVDPWANASQLATELLHSSGFTNNLFGWTLDFEDGGDVYSLNGDNYPLDMVAQMELAPSFPASKNYFIGSGAQFRPKSYPNRFHNPDIVNRFTDPQVVGREDKVPIAQAATRTHHFMKSNVSRQLNHRMRSMSGEALMNTCGEDDIFGLAVNSRLNQRYLKNANSIAAFAHLEEEEEQDTPASAVLALQLSDKSRLNQRYISNHSSNSNLKMELTNKASNESRSNRKNLYTRKNEKKLANQRSISMQELGLASTSNLNIRYFSRDKLNKTASLTGGSDDNDSDSLNKVQSLNNFAEEDCTGASQSKHFRKNVMSGRPLPAEPEVARKYHHRKPIRPSSHSSTTSSSFESDSSSCINDNESPIESELKDSSRYHSKKSYHHHHHKSKSQPYLASTSASRYSKDREDRDYLSIKGVSAMSDTSEAPSMASHIRNIRIPSHQSELDQYLDDLFSPVLDGNLDDAMSDARSLAQSIKGSSEDGLLVIEFVDLINAQALVRLIKGGVNEVEPNSTSRISLPNLTVSNTPDASLSGSNVQLNLGPLDPSMLQQQVMQQQMYQMQQRAFLASSLQQNLEIQKQLLQQNQQLQHLLAQAVSSPPTPLNGSETIQAIGRSTSMSSLAYPLPSISSPIYTPPPPSLNSSNAQPKAKESSMPLSSKPNIKILGPGAPPPPPPPPPEPQSPNTDVFGRAKTVRIGKWRWPPPNEDKEGQSSANFIEFKRKKQIEKQNHGATPPEVDTYNAPSSMLESDVTKPEVTLDYNAKKAQEVIKVVERTSLTSTSASGQAKEVGRKYSENNSVPGSIGKLRISTEMRAKLEALTIDQSVRSRKDGVKVVQSQSMDDLANMSVTSGSVKKLSEQRKALLEKQLMGSLRNASNGFMESAASTPNIKQSVQEEIHHHHHQQARNRKSHEVASEQSTQVKKFIKNNQHNQNVLRKSGSREFRERREELGPYNRLSLSSSQVNGSSNANANEPQHQLRPMYTPDRFFKESHQVDDRFEAIDARSSPWKSAPSKKCASAAPPPPPPEEVLPFSANKTTCLTNLPSDLAHCQDTPTEADSFQVDTAKIKTKLYPKNEINFYAYTKPRFRLNMRKEVFTPSETLDNPILLDLVFWQIVSDVYSGNCIRLSDEERDHFHKLLKSESIHSYNPSVYSAKASFKKLVIEKARQLPTYFVRLYPVTPGVKSHRTEAQVDYLGVAHSGLSLIRRDTRPGTPSRPLLTLLQRFSFEEISETVLPDRCTLQLVFYSGDWLTLHSPQANQIRNMLDKFVVEYKQSTVEFVRTIRDYSSQDASQLSFKKDTIIRVVKSKHIQVAKGWCFGILEYGDSGLFQQSHVVPLSARELQHVRGQIEAIMDDLATSPTTNGYKEDSLSLENHHQQQQHHNGHLNGHGTEFNSLWVDSRTDIMPEDAKLPVEDGTGSISTLPHGNEGNFSLLQFALFNFRECLAKYDLRGHLKENSLRGSIKLIEHLKTKRSNAKGGKGKCASGKEADNDWTWSEFANLVKYSKTPIQSSLLMLPSELNKVALECFSAIMRYMGDLAMLKNQNEVDCVYTILLNCHKYGQIRDEIYCQLMKQTTSNKSTKPDSCQRGWRLFSIVTAYFDCSEGLRPYLFKYLETAAYDKRRAFHVTASITLKNLKKTFKYGGRKNVPSIEEIAAISAGRTSKRQMYRLPGGTERILSTSCTTVVADIIEEICLMLNVTNSLEMEEFSLYCIIEGDPFTMPLNRDEYILDVTTELLKNGQLFYLIFCRSVWYYPLRLDSHLYIEVVFNQVAPDYLEGLLIILPSAERLDDELVEQVARIASLLHRAAEMDSMPSKDEIKYLLPKPILACRAIKPAQWVEAVQTNWNDMSALSTIEAKAQCLDILQKWPLFGSCFFAVKRIQNDSHAHLDHILALNKDGVHFLDMVTHEKVWKHPFSEVISTRKVRSEDGTLYLDMKCGNLMVQKITRIQTDQAHEISRLIRQYIEIEQHCKSGRSSQNGGGTTSGSSSEHLQLH